MVIPGITMIGMIGAITIGTTVMAVGLLTKVDSMADMSISRMVAESVMTADTAAVMHSRTQADMTAVITMAS